jgi:hypothetical protein
VEFGGSLGYKGAELLKAVADGQLDMAEMVASNVAGDAPVFCLSTLPLMINSWEEVELFNTMAKPYYDAAAKLNQKVIVIFPWPFGGLWANKRVEKIEDMKGLKIRFYDRNGSLFVAACGAQGLKRALRRSLYRPCYGPYRLCGYLRHFRTRREILRSMQIPYADQVFHRHQHYDYQ